MRGAVAAGLLLVAETLARSIAAHGHAAEALLSPHPGSAAGALAALVAVVGLRGVAFLLLPPLLGGWVVAWVLRRQPAR